MTVKVVTYAICTPNIAPWLRPPEFDSIAQRGSCNHLSSYLFLAIVRGQSPLSHLLIKVCAKPGLICALYKTGACGKPGGAPNQIQSGFSRIHELESIP